jgi:hypothetical protein
MAMHIFKRFHANAFNLYARELTGSPDFDWLFPGLAIASRESPAIPLFPLTCPRPQE